MLVYYETAEHSIAAGVVLPIVIIFAVSLKFWTRRIQKQPLKADDWLLVPATVLTIGIGAVLTYGAMHKAIGWPLLVPPGYQGNIDHMYSDQVSLSRNAQYAFLLLHPLALGLTKASLLFLYKRIFATDRKTHALIFSNIAIVVLWTIAFFFSELFQCKTNFLANWGTTHDIQTKCLKTTMILFAVCLTDFALDLLVLIIPIPLTLRLKLSTKKMAAVLGIFLLGAITVAASLLRLIIVAGHVFSPKKDTASHRFGSITASLYWGMVEASIGIIVACLPTIQFLFRKNRLMRTSRSVTMRPQGRVEISSPRYCTSSLSSKPTIQVEYSVDATYSNKDKSPVIDRAIVLV